MTICAYRQNVTFFAQNQIILDNFLDVKIEEIIKIGLQS